MQKVASVLGYQLSNYSPRTGRFSITNTNTTGNQACELELIYRTDSSHKLYLGLAVTKYVCVVQFCISRTLILPATHSLSGAERLSFVSRAEVKFLQAGIYRRPRDANSCDTVAGNTGHGMMSTRDKKSSLQASSTPTGKSDMRCIWQSVTLSG